MVGIRGIESARHLQHIEAEFAFDMSGRVLLVSDGVAIAGAELRVFDGDGAVDGHGVAVDIGIVVG
jgi:hypothetical protein